MNALGAAPALTVHRSRKLIPEFDLHRPTTVAKAVAIKAARGPGAVFMAGGIDVVNRMKFGVPVTDVIYLAGIAGLDEITETPDGLRLGALVTHDRLATSPLVARHLPALTQTWDDVANIRVRCKGTLGGNLMAGDPAYDFALAAMAANARLEFLEPGGATRTVAAPDPGALDSSPASSVCTESITHASGRSRSSVATTVSRSVSAIAGTASAAPGSRCARSRTCAVDSSPET